MTLEMMLDAMVFDQLDAKKAKDMLMGNPHRKTINYYLHHGAITKEPLREHELGQLNSLVNILQIIHNSEVDSPLSDADYETLHEMLIDSGIPRLTADVKLNDSDKQNHLYPQLRGSLDKVHYLTRAEKRINPSRKYLDDWIIKMETKYEKATGKKIKLDELDVLVQPKFDGASAVVEIPREGKLVWLTRGDTRRNLASDISHVMRQFNDLYSGERGRGIKFEVMVTEDDKEKINRIYRDKSYRNSRQIVTSAFNSNDVDFKAQYLYPVPLRIIHDGEESESIHPDLTEKFPTMICKLGDREAIRSFAMKNRTVDHNGMTLRTDGAVMTIMDQDVQRVLGRDKEINNFEVAYKFTEEYGYSKVIGVEFYVSEFAFITPVLVVNDIILKGNTVNHITLSNKERFDELDLHYGDTVKVLYDITPYATLDENCERSRKKRIEFTPFCPSCGSVLDMTEEVTDPKTGETVVKNVIQVQCKNPDCPSRFIGRILNWCNNVNIHNIGYQSLEALHNAGLLKKGIRSLYRLKSQRYDIEDIPGFGQLSSKKMIAEIESKRRLKDYEVFGSLGIETLNLKTFQSIFSVIPYHTFLEMISPRSHDELEKKLTTVAGIGDKKAESLINWLKVVDNRKELLKLLDELTVIPTYGNDGTMMGHIVFSGLRPSSDLKTNLEKRGWEVGETVTKKTTHLVVPELTYESGNVTKATSAGLPIITVPELLTLIGRK